jgi:hypothetical protein
MGSLRIYMYNIMLKQGHTLNDYVTRRRTTLMPCMEKWNMLLVCIWSKSLLFTGQGGRILLPIGRTKFANCTPEL